MTGAGGESVDRPAPSCFPNWCLSPSFAGSFATSQGWCGSFCSARSPAASVGTHLGMPWHRELVAQVPQWAHCSFVLDLSFIFFDVWCRGKKDGERLGRVALA